MKDPVVERIGDDLLIGRYIDFLINLAPTASDPIAVLDRIERAVAARNRFEADIEALLKEETG